MKNMWNVKVNKNRNNIYSVEKRNYEINSVVVSLYFGKHRKYKVCFAIVLKIYCVCTLNRHVTKV